MFYQWTKFNKLILHTKRFCCFIVQKDVRWMATLEKKVFPKPLWCAVFSTLQIVITFHTTTKITQDTNISATVSSA
jgi:hypothetical protein